MAEPETGLIELLAVAPGSLPPRPVVPPPRAPVADLQTLSSRAGRALTHAGLPFQAATDLALAWKHLGAAAMGWTIVGRLGAGQMDPQLEAMFGQPWDTLEVAAMRLGFGETVSAIDLCADAALLACGAPLQDKGRCTTWASSASAGASWSGRPPC